tara:strand:- start:8616 stop:9224 length:609 start_codon:yes stop_codon:yes gene_type:complete
MPGFTFKKLPLEIVYLTIIGDTSLITNCFSERAKNVIERKQMQVPEDGKTPRDPEQNFLDSLYPLNSETGCYTFPAGAFKKLFIEAARCDKNIPMTKVKNAITIPAEWVDIVTGVPPDFIPVPPNRRRDHVCLNRGTWTLAYRGEFKPPWRIVVPIRHNTTMLTMPQIGNLLQAGGAGVGIGAWRVEKDGIHGMFHVAQEGE